MSGLTFLIMFLALMALLALVPQALRRFHIPPIISMMLVGIVIGPNSLDLIRFLDRFLGRGYPAEQMYTVLDAMGLLGLLLLMALAGMEVDLGILRTERKAVALLSLLTFLLPAATGYCVYACFRPSDLIGKLLYASLFASHSVGIVFPVIRELKVVRTRFGVAVLASTIITDIASLVLLAVCVQMKRHTAGSSAPQSISLFDSIDPRLLGPFFLLLFLAAVSAYIAVALWIVPVVGDKVFQRIRPRDDTRITFFLLAVLAVVFVGELIGVSVIVGAFIAGMALVRVKAIHDDGHILHQKLEGVGYGFVIPFLFLTIGMKTDLRVLFSAWQNAAITLLTLLGLVASKIGSGWLALALAGFSHKKAICAGLMTVPQLTATLAAAAVGLELEIIDQRFFNAIVCLSIATTIPVPTLVRLLIIKGKITFDRAEDRLSVEPPAHEPDEELI